MGKIHSPFTFTGTLGNLSAYQMKGSDKIIIRTRGGASKKRIKTSPSFANTRRINAEFGGCSATTQWMKRAIHPLKPMCDSHVTGRLNRFWQSVQALDKKSKWGQRSIALSSAPWMLEGFALNENVSLDAILRTQLACSLSKDTLSATVTIPYLVPGVNFFPPKDYPVYSIMASLGIMPDMFWWPDLKKYHPNKAYSIFSFSYRQAETPWHAVTKGSPPATLELNYGNVPPDTAFTLVLSIGVAFGVMYDAGTVQPAKGAGSAKVWGCA